MITQESAETVQSFARVRIMREFGAAPYGGDLNRWPSKLVDAFVLLQAEHVRVEQLRIAAERPSQHANRR